jgi:putative endonuclease
VTAENFVYILRCGDGTLYTGWTNDLDRRLRTHAAGKGAKYTRARLPVELVYSERFETEHEARSRECRIKRLTRAEKLALIKSKEFSDDEKNGA